MGEAEVVKARADEVADAALSLALGIAGRRAEAEWSRTWLSETEMERVARAIGPEWSDPKIPADAWRAEPPPMVRD